MIFRSFSIDDHLLVQHFKELRAQIFDRDNLILLDYGGTSPRENCDGLENIELDDLIFCFWEGTRESMKPKIIGKTDSEMSPRSLKWSLYKKSEKDAVSQFANSSIKASLKIGLSLVCLNPSYIQESFLSWLAINDDVSIVVKNRQGRFWEYL